MRPAVLVIGGAAEGVVLGISIMAMINHVTLPLALVPVMAVLFFGGIFAIAIEVSRAAMNE
jgi:hypothetical protein